jgi:hypothetical protein
MLTDDLIEALARDPAPCARPTGEALRLPLALGALVAAAASLAVLGLRPDALEALAEGWFAAKLVLVLALAAAATVLVRHVSQPGRALSLWPLAAVAGLFAALVAADIVLLGSAEAGERALGSNALKCLVAIPLLSIAPLAAALWVLRDGAPTRPALAGALAGLLAGGIGAFAYGVHCTDDSPLFLSLWYTAGIGLVMTAGAWAGRRMLRW